MTFAEEANALNPTPQTIEELDMHMGSSFVSWYDALHVRAFLFRDGSALVGGCVTDEAEFDRRWLEFDVKRSTNA